MQSNECVAYVTSGALDNLRDVDQSDTGSCPTTHIELGIEKVGEPQEQHEHIRVF